MKLKPVKLRWDKCLHDGSFYLEHIHKKGTEAWCAEYTLDSDGWKDRYLIWREKSPDGPDWYPALQQCYNPEGEKDSEAEVFSSMGIFPPHTLERAKQLWRTGLQADSEEDQ